MTAPAASRRRWFTFSLATLFVVVTLVGLFLAWLNVELKWIKDRHEALAWAQQNHSIDWAPGASKSFPWRLRLLGESPLDDIVVIYPESLAEEQRARCLESLFPEAYVVICDIEIDPGTNKWTSVPYSEHRPSVTRIRRRPHQARPVKPQFAAEVVREERGEADLPGGGRVTSVVLVVQIRNLGKPSIADRWQLLVDVGGKIYRGKLTQLPPKLVFHTDKTLTYSREDSLYDQTVQAPIPAGGVVTGVLFFELSEVPVADLRSPSTKLSLTCVDAQYREIKVKPASGSLRDRVGAPDAKALHPVTGPSTRSPTFPQE